MGALVSVLWSYYVWLFPGNLPRVQAPAPAAATSSAATASKMIEGVVCKEDEIKNGECDFG